MECRRYRGDTVRLKGLATLDSLHGSVHATSLHYRVLFGCDGLLSWMSALGRSNDRHKYYRGCCNHGYSEKKIFFDSDHGVTEEQAC